jgi:hypothetical protein
MAKKQPLTNISEQACREIRYGLRPLRISPAHSIDNNGPKRGSKESAI